MMLPHFVVIDFEFREAAPGRVEVLCMVAIDLTTDRVYSVWLEGNHPASPPFPCEPDTIIVAHAVAPAEARCWRAMGWSKPGGWIDTYVEARVLASGERPEGGFGLLACCQRHGISAVSSDEKDEMRNLIIRGGPYSAKQKAQILSYCESDVVETKELFQRQWKS